MCHKLDPREVLEYLNELGYTNISAVQLKDFMMDLKKLMKYEEHLQEYYISDDDYEEEEEPKRDVFNELYSTETIASKAKKANPPKSKILKEHVITVSVKKVDTTDYARNKSPKEPIKYSANISKDKCQSCPESLSSNFAAVSSVPTLTTTKSTSTLPIGTGRTVTSASTNKKSSVLQKPHPLKSSFIRPRSTSKPRKCDPVALYHQYKEEWKKIKFPGEHSHKNTRWAIREKLLGDY